ncbi:hypothetical protein J2X61_007059 [Bacillus sp. 3255]|nr:hypothetical protein [Bacillus sp. 3255]
MINENYLLICLFFGTTFLVIRIGESVVQARSM